jgi:hypothetical protein
MFDIPSGRFFAARRGFFVVGGRASPSLLLGRKNFLGGIAAVRCGSGDEFGGWIRGKWRENGWEAAGSGGSEK